MEKTDATDVMDVMVTMDAMEDVAPLGNAVREAATVIQVQLGLKDLWVTLGYKGLREIQGNTDNVVAQVVLDVGVQLEQLVPKVLKAFQAALQTQVLRVPLVCKVLWVTRVPQVPKVI